MKNTFVLLLVFSILTIGCSSSKSTDTTRMSADTTRMETYQSIAEEKLEGKIVYEMNENESYVLCKTYILRDNVKYVSFFVYDLKNEKVTYEPKLRTRNVNWTSEHQITVNLFMGIPTGEGTDNSFNYDVVKKRKITEEEL